MLLAEKRRLYIGFAHHELLWAGYVIKVAVSIGIGVSVGDGNHIVVVGRVRCRLVFFFAVGRCHCVAAEIIKVFGDALHEVGGLAAVGVHRGIGVGVKHHGGVGLVAGKGAEKPCFQDGLRLEIVGYRLRH